MGKTAKQKQQPTEASAGQTTAGALDFGQAVELAREVMATPFCHVSALAEVPGDGWQLDVTYRERNPRGLPKGRPVRQWLASREAWAAFLADAPSRAVPPRRSKTQPAEQTEPAE